MLRCFTLNLSVVLLALLSVTCSRAPSSGIPSFLQLPLAFEINAGQFPDDVRFVSRAQGHSLSLTDTGAVFENARGEALRLSLIASNSNAPVYGEEELPGRTNYFIGSDPAKWRTGIKTFRKVRYVGVYPGIDVVYYGNSEQQFEFDFVVAPHANPDSIEIAFEGELQAPLIYQHIDGVRRNVVGGFVARGRHLAFEIGEYDRNRPLIIDPVINYSTYLGDIGRDVGYGIAVDAAGNTYVAGFTNSPRFPGSATSPREFLNAFVTKFNPAGTSLIYSTYLGGNSGRDDAFGLAIDLAGNAYVSGSTHSSDFPVANAVQSSFIGGEGCFPPPGATPCSDGFVTKLGSTGAIVYSTYLGGDQADIARGIAVDRNGSAYVTGATQSTNFPTVNALQPQPGGAKDAFVTKFSPEGTQLIYSTYFGGSSDDNDFSRASGGGIAVDSFGNAYITGTTWSQNFPTVSPFQATLLSGPDAFVSKLNPNGSALIFSTYLGGSDYENATAIAVEGGRVIVTGFTESANFPIAGNTVQPARAGGADAFVTKLDASGSSLIYSTYLGGSAEDVGFGVTTDIEGNAHIVGQTASTNFRTVDAVQSSYRGGIDAFTAKLSKDGDLTFSTYLGGTSIDSGYAIAHDSDGSTLITGETQSTAFPTAAPFQSAYRGAADAFITKLLHAVTLSELSYTINDPQTITRTSTDTSTTTSVGYARIQPNAGQPTPASLAIFGFRTGNILISEAAVPGMPAVQSGRIYAEIGAGVNTGIAIANPNAQTATLNFFFTDANGVNFRADSTTISANGQIAKFLNEAPFNGGAAVQGTFTFNSSLPVAVIALRGFTNQRSEFLLTTLPVSPLSAPLAETVIFPHFADGGGWTTQLVLVNPTDEILNGALQFRRQDGTLTADGTTYNIPARSSRKVQLAGTGTSTQSGSIRILPAANNRTPSGLGIFTFKPAAFTVTEAGVPSLSAGTAFRMFAEARGDFSGGRAGSIQTGVAIANPASTQVSVAVELYSLTGLGSAATTTVVPANGQIALFLNQLFAPEFLPNPFQGFIRLTTTSAAGISVIGLRGRYNERGDFLITTTTPVIETSVAPTAELFYPHLASGGGYSTQLILFSNFLSRNFAGNVRFFAQSGQSLNLSLR